MPSPVEAKAVAEAAASSGAANSDAPVSVEPPKKKQRSAPKKSTVSRLLAKTHANESERLQTNQFLLLPIRVLLLLPVVDLQVVRQ